MKCFNGFCQDGVVQSETVNEILRMMGLRVNKDALDAIIAEVDEDGKEAKLLHLSLPHPINRAREVLKTLMCVHLGSALVTRDEFVNLLMV